MMPMVDAVSASSAAAIVPVVHRRVVVAPPRGRARRAVVPIAVPLGLVAGSSGTRPHGATYCPDERRSLCLRAVRNQRR
jgi:hypothetical protein